MKEYNTLRRIYAWVGFVIIWFLVSCLVLSLIVGQDKTIEFLVKLLS